MIIPLPKAQSKYTDTSSGEPTYPFYQYLYNLDNRVVSLENSSGSGSPPSGSFLPITSNVVGANSIIVYGSLAQGIAQVSLDGDVDVPLPTQYYGSDLTLTKGWYNISDAFISSVNILKSVDIDGITSFDLSDVTLGTSGRLYGLSFDAKGRLSQQHTIDIVGVTDRTTITGGDGSGSTITVDIASTYAGQTSITTLGTVTTGTWNASPIAAIYGGTGQSSYAVGDILYANTTTTLARLPDVATGSVLRSGGVGLAPAWGPVNLGTDVTGVLPISQGGTGQTTASTAFNALSPTTAAGDIIYNNGTTNINLPIGTSGQVLTVVSGAPAWVSPTTGTVTSVGLTAPAEISVSGSTITSSGTLVLSWSSQSANMVFAGPASGGSATPSFRSLVTADLPPMDMATLWVMS